MKRTTWSHSHEQPLTAVVMKKILDYYGYFPLSQQEYRTATEVLHSWLGDSALTVVSGFHLSFYCATPGVLGSASLTPPLNQSDQK